MGQSIVINTARRIGDVLVLDTDRSLSGQDGTSYTRAGNDDDDTFPARLADRLFTADSEIDRVHIMSNTVSVERPTGWSDESSAVVVDTVATFFRFYPD